MLETTKNFLSNNTDLDILNNLTELKRDDVTSLKYFSHSTTPSVNNNSTLYPDTYFFNSDHLNSLGSSYFTPILIQSIREQ